MNLEAASSAKRDATFLRLLIAELSTGTSGEEA